MTGKPPRRDTHLTRGRHTKVRTAAGRKTSSTRWLDRQLNDPYVGEARKRGYRSRAAFKLLELDARFQLLRPGLRVLDLGAAPGGWSQVVVERTGGPTGSGAGGEAGGGAVVAIDRLAMAPLAGVSMLEADLTEPAALDAVRRLLDGQADLVLSDMAPNTTGHRATDHLRIVALAELAVDIARNVLAPGGAFVAKVFQGGTDHTLLAAIKQDFTTVRHAKPPASRSDSAEIYVVATGFRGAAPDVEA